MNEGASVFSYGVLTNIKTWKWFLVG